MNLKMLAVLAIAVACLIYLLVLTFVYDPLTSQAQEPDTFCSIDYNQSGYIDISDITELTGRFGQPVVHPYDVAPVDGYVTVADISELTAEFGNECYETSGEEEAVGEFALTLFTCQWRTWHFPRIKNTVTWTATIATRGQTTCFSDNPWNYRSECFTGTEVRHLSTEPEYPNYWLAGVSLPFDWAMSDDCYAYTGPFQVPMFRNINDFVHHAVYEYSTGRYVHGPHHHRAEFDTAIVYP